MHVLNIKDYIKISMGATFEKFNIYSLEIKITIQIVLIDTLF